MVVVDECYYEICGKTVVDLIHEFSNLVVLRSLSKSFALAGLRVGYCISNADVIAFLQRGDQTFTVNRLALIAAESALEDLEYMQRNIAETQRERDILGKGFSELGFLVYPSEANFLLINWEQVSSSNPVDRLKERKIFVSDFHGKQGLQACFRTAVGSPEENRALLHTVEGLER
jgi:histidinol-phosphate aminotransferase